MQALRRWKSSQFDRTGTFDLFRLTWVRELLERVWRTKTNKFSGVLSALYAADEVVAVHMGMQSGNVLAWWFPAYNPQYESFSPGLILLTKILQASNDAGIQRLDLGRGAERYKSSFANDAWQISEGVVDKRPMNRTIRRGLFQLRNLATSSPWASLPLRYYRKFKQSRAVQREG
jgi:CelD/BcsL family acetyltransferase involved in cellulose biosynthesis